MIVIDDYNEGVIHAGKEKYDMKKVSAIMWDEVDKLEPNNTEHNPRHKNDGVNDFYVFYMDEKDLFKYMTDRNATNYIVGV